MIERGERSVDYCSMRYYSIRPVADRSVGRIYSEAPSLFFQCVARGGRSGDGGNAEKNEGKRAKARGSIFDSALNHNAWEFLASTTSNGRGPFTVSIFKGRESHWPGCFTDSSSRYGLNSIVTCLI